MAVMASLHCSVRSIKFRHSSFLESHRSVAGCNLTSRLNWSKASIERQRRTRRVRGSSKAFQSFEGAHGGQESPHHSDREDSEENAQISPQPIVKRGGVGRLPHEARLALVFCSIQQRRTFQHICRCSSSDQNETKDADLVAEDKKDENLGVRLALVFLRFYKREISPLIPASCRYVPTCSEFAMEAYKKYGFAKGSILTALRLARCNPLGSSGFDPPRWFGEERPPQV